VRPYLLGTLATEIRDRLGPAPERSDWPLVSIVVINRNGVEHLRRLFAGLVERTDYPRLELILVDNGSSDESLDFACSFEAPFPVSTLANTDNESFSAANNQGAEPASGELLLFLNNDIEPFESGWLRELVACLENSEAGAVAATLLCRDVEHTKDFKHGYGVQHRGLYFAEEDGRVHAELRGWEDDPLDAALGEDAECDALAAACLLIAQSTFKQIGGFTPGYFYGCEDVDLCLKLRESGLPVVCSGRSITIHHPVSTRRTMPFEQARETKLANRRLLWENWGPRLDGRGPSVNKPP
jgi:O-antigen biosynthesis protein